MLLLNKVSKRYGNRTVLQDVSFSIDDGAKLALLGPNGCGKTTLARIIAGHEQPDFGSIGGDYARAGCCYLPQGTAGAAAVCAADLLGDSKRRLWLGGAALSDAAGLTADRAMGLATDFEEAGGWTALEQLEAVLRGLDVAYIGPTAPVAQLSGGERTRLGIAGLLAEPGSFLLLDEPSNHLDLEGLVWLEQYLRSFPGGVLLISHDRALVDAVAGAVVELGGTGQGARRFAGGYTALIEEKGREHERQLAAYRDQQEKIRRTEEDIRRVKLRAARFDGLSQNDFWRGRGKKVARIAKVRERKLERMLASEEKLERPGREWKLKADLAEAPRGGDLVAELQAVSLTLGGRRLLDGVDLQVRHGDRLVITGANGSGKTTLLRLLLGEQAPDEGSVRLGAAVAAGYLSQQQESLAPERTPLEEVRHAAPLSEAAARTFLHRFLFSGDDVFVRNDRLSYGQRARLALGVLVLSGVNLLLLDEPLNHLDIGSRERFEAALVQFSGTVIAVSHDRYFMQRFARHLLVLQDGRLHSAEVAALG